MKFNRDHDLSEALVQLLTIQALSKGNPSVTQDLAYGLVKSGLALPILARAARVTKSWAEVGMAWAGHGAIPGTREQFEADIRKAVVSVGTTGDAEWASPLVAISTLVQSFFKSLRNRSLFDTLIASGVMPLKPNVRFSVTVGVGTGNSAGEARWTPVTSMQFESEQTMPSKALALVIVSEDLLKMGGDLATNMLSAELKNAVALATDQVAVSILTAGLSPLSSAGNPRADLKQAFAAINLAQWSRPCIAVSPAMLKTMALMGGEGVSGNGDGPPSFPDLVIQGSAGSIAGVPCIGVDALSAFPGSPSGDSMLVVDAAQIAGDAGTFDYLPSGNAGILMDTAPSATSPEDQPVAAELVSMFQTNSVALRLTRWFNLTRARPTACALVEGCNYT